MPAARRLLYRILVAILAFVFIIIVLVIMILPAYVDRRLNRRSAVRPLALPAAAQKLHQKLFIADLHADPLLWNRDLTKRSTHGHIDLPRMQAGNYALQVFGVATKVPRTLSYERNDDRTDLITPLAIVQCWPPRAWTSLKERALYQARKLNQLAKSSQGKLVVIETRQNLIDFVEKRKQWPDVVGGLLGMEGMHPLEGKLENLEVLYRAGFRMMAPVHFFDNELGGSTHGMKKGGLTDFGRDAVMRMEELGIIVDVAHASAKMIDDVLALATKPVACSHTGVKGTCAGNRNLSDKHLRGIARTGGVVGIGLWQGAVCATDVRATARAMRYTANLIGVDHVALGSDFDGAITAPIDAGEMSQVTAALLEEGFSEDEIFKIMGGNVLRLMLAVLSSR